MVLMFWNFSRNGVDEAMSVPHPITICASSITNNVHLSRIATMI